MDDVADRLDQASDALSALSRDVPTLAVTPGAFAALPALSPAGREGAAGAPPSAELAARRQDAPGLPGRVGQALHDHWIAVLEARSREASVAAARLAEMARSVRATRRQYAETDEAVERRFTQEL